MAAEKGGQSLHQIKECLQSGARYRLGDLAQHVATPFRLDDLIVSNTVRDILDDFIFEAGERNSLWENETIRRLFPQGRGLMALLSGPSGTGKTMAAQVIANELGLALFRIDLAAVVSKYVGETSRNLERILSRAQNMDVVLLFDEADALLGKRTEIKDAHDRFANTDTNYLLQALESDYQGIALLSTNRKENIDEAFLRRIRYLIEFPKPDAQQRLILWQRLTTELAGPAAKHVRSPAFVQNLQTIAQGIELTGAQIKYAVLAALFAARRKREPLHTGHLLHGIDRELMKEGRVLTQREKDRLNVYEK
jgi:SpoVK/Ycf46/Vps4 family AAA+-type ATPase